MSEAGPVSIAVLPMTEMKTLPSISEMVQKNVPNKTPVVLRRQPAESSCLWFYMVLCVIRKRLEKLVRERNRKYRWMLYRYQRGKSCLGFTKHKTLAFVRVLVSFYERTKRSKDTRGTNVSLETRGPLDKPQTLEEAQGIWRSPRHLRSPKRTKEMTTEQFLWMTERWNIGYPKCSVRRIPVEPSVGTESSLPLLTAVQPLW